jgi:hypothetical protein
MLSCLFFTTITFAHLHMIQPLPLFTNGQGNQNAPSSQCSIINYSPGSPNQVSSQFNAGLKDRFPSLKSYFDACGATQCGNTKSNHIVPVPSENTIKITIGARHVGPLEIWLDDTRMVQSDQLQDSFPVDFSKCVGQCTVRLVMAALHNFPAELYDNCVVIDTGRGGGGVRLPGRGQVPVTSRAAGSVTTVAITSTVASTTPTNDPQVPTTETPSEPPQEPTPETPQEPNNNATEWTCSVDSKKLLRKVGNSTYDFACPIGTLCTPVVGIDYPVCQ